MDRGSTRERGNYKVSIYACFTDRMSVPLWCHVSEALLSLYVFLLHERHSHTGRSSLSKHTHMHLQTHTYTHARGLKEQVNISCDVSLLNVSSGGCKYSISLPVIGQKWEIIMKHEGKIILYSCDNISLFHKHAQIFINHSISSVAM